MRGDDFRARNSAEQKVRDARKAFYSEERGKARETWCATHPAYYGTVIQAARPVVAMLTAVLLTFTPMQAQAADDGSWVSMGSYKTTAYCNCKRCCGRWSGGPTASGMMPEEGRTVACGSMPLGTHIMINGHEYVVEDRGVRGKHIDIYMDGHGRALQHGVQYAEVYVWVED